MNLDFIYAVALLRWLPPLTLQLEDEQQRGQREGDSDQLLGCGRDFCFQSRGANSLFTASFPFERKCQLD